MCEPHITLQHLHVVDEGMGGTQGRGMPPWWAAMGLLAPGGPLGGCMGFGGGGLHIPPPLGPQDVFTGDLRTRCAHGVYPVRARCRYSPREYLLS